MPIRSQLALWNQDASAITSAIFISSDGCNWMPPNSIQRCAPLPTCPIRSTSTSSASANPYSGHASRARKRMSTIASPSIITSPDANRIACLDAYGSGEPPAAEYSAA